MYLVVAHLRPELWPSSVGILSAQEIFHAFAEGFLVFQCLGSLVESCQIEHLHVGGIVVGGGVVLAVLLAQYFLHLFMAHRFHHVDVLGPSASYSLVSKNLVIHLLCLFRFVESHIGFAEHILVPLLCLGGEACSQNQDNR